MLIVLDFLKLLFFRGTDLFRENESHIQCELIENIYFYEVNNQGILITLYSRMLEKILIFSVYPCINKA